MGGATIVGLHGIQFLRLAGYRIISTNSSNTNELVAEYGAEASIDYKMGAIEQLQEINRISAGHLKLVLHAVEGQGLDLGVAALTESKAPGKRLASVENDMYDHLFITATGYL
jgi:NADPH:quinone reductase-like Zn-dependent oxidoreductase